MAYMYPEKPRECTKGSMEEEMFSSLEKLPKEYSVFHSFSIVRIIDDTLYESETDFVVFHPLKGILCIEAKAGMIQYENEEWKYGSGIPMSHGGPFNQASQNKWKLKKLIEDSGLSYLLNKCKLLHAVWFPSISMDHLSGISLPSEADINLILTKESMENIEKDISRIFDYKISNGVTTNLGNKDSDLLLNRILAPSFNLISLAELKSFHRENVFKSMLKEQVALLNYLEEQNSAIINGMAGTGKTIMAVEKARRLAEKGEKVLFLCYNAKLKEYLSDTYTYENISYYTIDGLACKLCDTFESDYSLLEEKLYEVYENNTFPWKHVIIDEGQDFGKEHIEETNIIELLKDIVAATPESCGTFYIFYDINQLVQSKKPPSYISEADCKLTLYRNCRNTENIAITSSRLLGSTKKPVLISSALHGNSPELYFLNETESFANSLNRCLDNILKKELAGDIVILTCKTEKTSRLSGICDGDRYIYNGRSFLFTTYRKFKGLEADAVIIIDADSCLLDPDNSDGEKALYVASSRAKYELSIICEAKTEEVVGILEKLKVDPRRINRRPYKALATSFNAKYMDFSNL